MVEDIRRYGCTIARGALLFAGGLAMAYAVLAQAPPDSKPVPFVQSQVDRGRAVFAVQCATCHGAVLDGGPAGPALNGAAFRDHYEDKPASALFNFIREKMPPGNAGTLPSSDYADTIAFILSVNGAKPGEMQLPERPQSLAAYRVGSGLSPLPASSPKPLARELFPPIPPDSLVVAAEQARAARMRKSTPVTDDMLRRPADGDWLHPHRTYDAQAWSPLTQISRTNISKLETAWVLSLPPSRNEITPLVHDGIMYVASGNVLQALDARNGELMWQYTNPGPVGIVRGLGIYGETIFYPAETDVVALHARTGTMVWRTPVATGGFGIRLAAAPIVAKGRVFQPVGYCIGPYPGGCYVVALDATTGKELWRFHSIARPGQPGGDSWNNTPVNERHGGGIWTAGSYDPQLDLLYFGVAQTYSIGSLLKNYDGKPGGNDGLYTDSTVALRPTTGELAWYYQHLSRDVWDLDAGFEQTLATMTVDGKPRRTVTTGSKLSIFDTVDAATGKYLFSYDTGLQNLVTSTDPRTGAKTIDPSLDLRANVPKHFCTSNFGGRDWPATAFNPRSGVLYVPENDICSEVTLLEDDSAANIKIVRRPNSDGMVGRVTAVDVAGHKTLWVQRRRAPHSSSILGTAGGLILEGSRDRSFRASDERTGRVLWQTRLNAPPASNPIAFGVDGVEFIAVVAGGGGGTDSIVGPILTPEIPSPPAGTTLWVFRLPEK